MISVQPTDNDVLLVERGSEIWNHEGNLKFRSLVAEYQDLYESSPMAQKVQITRCLAFKLKSAKIRVLQHDAEKDEWYEVDHKTLIGKVCTFETGVSCSTTTTYY
jgi:hypothetical protein